MCYFCSMKIQLLKHSVTKWEEKSKREDKADLLVHQLFLIRKMFDEHICSNGNGIYSLTMDGREDN